MGNRLQIQLYCAKTGESITLPLNPESTDISNSKEVKTYNILDYGEVSVRGSKQLKRLTLANMFPSDSDSYFSLLASLVRQLDYKPYSQQETVDMVNRWVDNDEIIRVIISGHLNAEFTVENHISQIKESTSDIGYTIDLVEYKNPQRQIQTYTPKDSKLVKLKKRVINKYVPSQITGKTGQTVYKLAKLTYGGKWQELADRNHITDANISIAGQIVEMVPV